MFQLLYGFGPRTNRKASIMVSFSGGFTETIVGDPSTPVATDVSLAGGAVPVTVEIGGDPGNPLTTDVNIGGTSTPVTTDVNIGGTKTPVSTDITLHTPDVMRTSSDIKTDSRMSIDLKPVVTDMCVTVNFGQVPEMCVRQPYETRGSITLFGTEIMAFEFRGENRTYTENMPDRPAVVGAAWAQDRHDRPGYAQHGQTDEPADGDGPGLVIPI
jgi:hypothetical protein